MIAALRLQPRRRHTIYAFFAALRRRHAILLTGIADAAIALASFRCR